MTTATSTRPVFVGGCRRSGTTLLRTMLTAHPDLAIPHETRILVDAYRRRVWWGDLARPENRRRLAEWVVAEGRSTRYKRLTPDAGELVEAMVAAGPTLGSVLGAGFRLHAARQGKPRWGDKRPSLVLNLDAVFALFPDAQFVNVVRDPRAVAASIRRVGEQYGWADRDVPSGVETWRRSARAADLWRRRLRADQLLDVRYEHLVADPRAELARVAAFLGLDPTGLEPMVRHHETADVRSRGLHVLVSQPVTTDPVSTWQAELRPEEVALVERVLRRQMRHYAYAPVAGGARPPAALVAGYRRRRAQRDLTLVRRRVRELSVRSRHRYRWPVADGGRPGA